MEKSQEVRISQTLEGKSKQVYNHEDPWRSTTKANKSSKRLKSSLLNALQTRFEFFIILHSSVASATAFQSWYMLVFHTSLVNPNGWRLNS